MLATAFTVVYTRVDQLMIKHLIDTTSVGIYDAAVRIAEVWYFIPGAIISSVFPAIINARNTNNGTYERRLLHFFGGILLITASIAVPIFIFSDQIVYLFYGSNYAGAESVLRIYVLSGIAYGLSMAMTQYLSAEHHERAIFMSSLFGMVVNVVLNIFWIPAYGINGAAWATLVAYTLVPLSVLIHKPTRLHIRKTLLSWRKRQKQTVL
jgi:O-antigen/teichoic acid export membrane protein